MYEIMEQYGFVATHQIHGLPAAHPCAAVHSHRWDVEIVFTASRLLPTDCLSELVILEPVRQYVTLGLDGKHLNDLLIGPATPARLAQHLAAWCHENLTSEVSFALSAVVISAGARSSAKYTVRREK